MRDVCKERGLDLESRRTDTYEAIPEGAKIKVHQKVLVEVLEDCWALLAEVQKVKHEIQDLSSGTDSETHMRTGPNLFEAGVDPRTVNEMAVKLGDMGEFARLALEKLLFLRKAVMDKPVEPEDVEPEEI